MRTFTFCLICLLAITQAMAEEAPQDPTPSTSDTPAATTPVTPPPASNSTTTAPTTPSPKPTRVKSKASTRVTTKKKIQSSSSGDSKFFNASLVPDIAVFPRTQKIVGFTLSIWGENEQQSFALGLVNGMRGSSGGVALGIFNYAESYTGGMLSAVNWVKNDFVGFQGGIVNFVAGSAKGVQFGAGNYAGVMKGLQLGIVNYADRMESGLQIGLVNIINSNKKWFGDFPKSVAPGMVIANWSF